ncbi:hypothetical protein OJ252_3315 [Cryptosporidium canis]|uniref:SPX domain-containing protein n=1 Tax=Cryptosporidium canis TaxID=195482 RepID=A0ABQ8P2Q5_9CRYT|nr:hypothetical protein OJ252_3315 [Cryptosporidium canis]
MDSEFCIEDVIVSIYGMEMLLKQIKERQIRNCLYDWKYKSLLEKDLAIQKKKYNKYMLDGFYALARQTQSICMLFHTMKLIEYKQKKFAMDRFVCNMKVAWAAEDRAKVISSSEESSVLENDPESPLLDEAVLIEFQQNLVRFFHGINSVVNIIESKRHGAIYKAFCLIKGLPRRRSLEKAAGHQNSASLSIRCEKSSNSGALGPPLSPVGDADAHDKENISGNKLGKNPLNNGLTLNREELYFEQVSGKKQFYTRKQNESFNNGPSSKPPSLDRTALNYSAAHDQRHISAEFAQKHYPNPNFSNHTGNVIIGSSIIDFTHANPLLFSTIKSPANSNPVLAVFPQHPHNPNFPHNFQGRKPTHFGAHLNPSNQLSAGSTPLNTTKYSIDYPPSLGNPRLKNQNKAESSHNLTVKRYYSSDRKSPRSTEVAKSILNPCINFTQDSTNLIQNITDSFKSVILN